MHFEIYTAKGYRRPALLDKHADKTPTGAVVKPEPHFSGYSRPRQSIWQTAQEGSAYGFSTIKNASQVRNSALPFTLTISLSDVFIFNYTQGLVKLDGEQDWLWLIKLDFKRSGQTGL